MGVRIDHEAQAQSAISELLQIAHHAVGPWVHEGGCARLGVRDEVREAALRAQLLQTERDGLRFHGPPPWFRTHQLDARVPPHLPG
jgi:hypothetical protein